MTADVEVDDETGELTEATTLAFSYLTGAISALAWRRTRYRPAWL